MRVTHLWGGKVGRGWAESQQALLLGLEHLVNISYVDNIEVRVTHLWGGKGGRGWAESQQALLLGLEHLVNISYVDNIEVRVTYVALVGARRTGGQVVWVAG